MPASRALVRVRMLNYSTPTCLLDLSSSRVQNPVDPAIMATTHSCHLGTVAGSLSSSGSTIIVPMATTMAVIATVVVFQLLFFSVIAFPHKATVDQG